MYWSDRKKRLDASMAKDESRLYAKRAAYYDREAARLDKEIAAYYSKYSVNGVLSYRNLLETLSDGDKQLLIQNMDEFVKKYPEYADLVPVRESIYKLNRLEGLRQSIAMQQLEMGASDIAAAREFFRRQSLRYANGAAQHLGLGSSFYTIDSDMVNRFVGNDWCDGKDFSARIWANRDKLARTLHTDVLNGVIRGDSYQRVSRAVQKKFTEVSRKDIERLVFTEDTYLSNEAAMSVFATAGVTEEYIYVCAPVGACPICQALNGQRFQIKDRMPGVNFPPMHPWCRCFFDPVVKSLDDFIAAERKNALTSGGDGGIIISESGDALTEIKKLGDLNTTMLEHEFGKIQTSEIIITNERIDHIKQRHPEDYALFEKYGAESVMNPDCIIKDEKNTGTVFMVKKLNDTNLNVVVRLVLCSNNEKLKNSVMTFYRIREKNLKKLEKKNKVLYKKE